jgi:RNA-directed DNA polymerase
MVSGTSSPDDPALASYWASRRRKGPPLPIGRPDLRLLQAQHGRCPLCGDFLLHADHQPQSPHEWEQWLKVTRKALARHHLAADRGPGTPDVLKPRLVHAHCQRRHTAAGRTPALLHAYDATELA